MSNFQNEKFRMKKKYIPVLCEIGQIYSVRSARPPEGTSDNPVNYSGKSIREMVKEFHSGISSVDQEIPGVPPKNIIELRITLITEEFIEFLQSVSHKNDTYIENAIFYLQRAVNNMSIEVDLPEMADALADLAYVIEGTNLAFGIDGEKILEEVHSANMRKLGGGRRADGKAQKPEGWQPPDIVGVLKKQGWNPNPEEK